MTSLIERVSTLLAERLSHLATNCSPGDLQRGLLDLEHVILSDVLTEDEGDLVVEAAEGSGLLRVCQSRFGPFETLLEQSVAQEVLRLTGRTFSNTGDILHNYRQRYHTLAAREVRLADLTPDDRVLFIGSGPLPISAMEYVVHAGCTVDAVDCLAEPVEFSTNVIAELELASRLRVLHSAGEDVPVGAYDAIIIGVLAEPKAVVLDHLDAEARDDCRIVCRTTRGMREFIYPRALPRRLRRFRPADFDGAAGDQVISLQLLTAAGGAPGWEVAA
jgi:hypothetical protein